MGGILCLFIWQQSLVKIIAFSTIPSKIWPYIYETWS